MSEEFVCLYNFIEDDHAIETFFDNLSLRVKVVILDNVDPESDFYTKTIKSRWVNALHICSKCFKIVQPFLAYFEYLYQYITCKQALLRGKKWTTNSVLVEECLRNSEMR